MQLSVMARVWRCKVMKLGAARRASHRRTKLDMLLSITSTTLPPTMLLMMVSVSLGSSVGHATIPAHQPQSLPSRLVRGSRCGQHRC